MSSSMLLNDSIKFRAFSLTLIPVAYLLMLLFPFNCYFLLSLFAYSVVLRIAFFFCFVVFPFVPVCYFGNKGHNAPYFHNPYETLNECFHFHFAFVIQMLWFFHCQYHGHKCFSCKVILLRKVRSRKDLCPKLYFAVVLWFFYPMHIDRQLM